MKHHKDTVRLRTKPLGDGRESVYLDIYSGGKRKYEFLRLYLMPEKDRAVKAANKETMRVAEAIKAKRMVELQEKTITGRSAEDVPFLDYFKSLGDLRTKPKSHLGWENTLKHIKKYCGKAQPNVSDIDRTWVMGLRTYLDKKAKTPNGTLISQGSKCLYWAIFKCSVHEAVRDGYMTFDPGASVPGFKKPQSQREFLTVDELRRAVSTPCADPQAKQAFIFSCLTGLRWSDICALKWEDIRKDGKGTAIKFVQRKTGASEYMYVNPQAEETMGHRPENGGPVFPGLGERTMVRKYIQRWIKAAGIGKHITFHSARHTFAVMMLNLGTDIYTVSKLLGHESLETTRIYAKIVDETKRLAVSNIPPIF